MPAFPLEGTEGTAALGELKISHSQQQPQVFLLAPHQDWTKRVSRCNHSTWFLHELYATFPSA